MQCPEKHFRFRLDFRDKKQTHSKQRYTDPLFCHNIIMNLHIRSNFWNGYNVAEYHKRYLLSKMSLSHVALIYQEETFLDECESWKHLVIKVCYVIRWISPKKLLWCSLTWTLHICIKYAIAMNQSLSLASFCFPSPITCVTSIYFKYDLEDINCFSYL